MLSSRPPRTIRERSPLSPRRRRRRWLVGVGVTLAIILLVVVAALVFFASEPAPAVLTLPREAPSAPVGPVDGGWRVSAGSVAGFRLQQSVIGLTKDVAGRTAAVSGMVSIARGTVTSATVSVGLGSVRVSGKTEPAFTSALGTSAYPVATITLVRPVALSGAFATGRAIRSTAACSLTMHGITRDVTASFAARWSGSELQVAGSIPVVLADWGIRAPAGFGFLGSLASHGSAEFLLILRR